MATPRSDRDAVSALCRNRSATRHWRRLGAQRAERQLGVLVAGSTEPENRGQGTPSPGSRPRSGIHAATVDRDGLTGDEIAVGRGKEDQRAKQVLRLLVAG